MCCVCEAVAELRVGGAVMMCLRMLCSPDFVHAPSRFTMLRCGPRCVMIFSSDIRACFSLERAVAGRGKRNGDYRSTMATSDGSPPRLQLICTFPSLWCFSIAASTCKNCKQMYLPPGFLQFSTVNSRNVWLLVNPLCYLMQGQIQISLDASASF